MKRRTYYLLPLLLLPAFSVLGCDQDAKQTADEPAAAAEADNDRAAGVKETGGRKPPAARADSEPAATAQAWASPPTVAELEDAPRQKRAAMSKAPPIPLPETSPRARAYRSSRRGT